MSRKRQSGPGGLNQLTIPPALSQPRQHQQQCGASSSWQAAAAAQGVGAQKGGASGLSPLHAEILEFTALMTPEEDERLLVRALCHGMPQGFQAWAAHSSVLFGR